MCALARLVKLPTDAGAFARGAEGVAKDAQILGSSCSVWEGLQSNTYLGLAGVLETPELESLP